MKGNGLIILGAIVLIVIIIIAINHQRKKTTETLCFDLPASFDPSIFGSKYWNAFHSLASKIPCGMCRGFAEKFIVFFHDTVNMKLGKPLYDKENFDYFTSLFAKINQGENPFEKYTEKE